VGKYRIKVECFQMGIGLDRPCSDDVQVNISSSSFRDEGHQNMFVVESEVGRT